MGDKNWQRRAEVVVGLRKGNSSHWAWPQHTLWCLRYLSFSGGVAKVWERDGGAGSRCETIHAIQLFYRCVDGIGLLECPLFDVEYLPVGGVKDAR